MRWYRNSIQCAQIFSLHLETVGDSAVFDRHRGYLSTTLVRAQRSPEACVSCRLRNEGSHRAVLEDQRKCGISTVKPQLNRLKGEALVR